MAEKLYHYTSAANLMSMLISKELWLTEHRFMNDRDEGSFAKRLVINAMDFVGPQNWISKLEGRPDSQILISKFMQGLERFRRGVGPGYDIPEGYSVFVLSLSCDGDSLSQWRAYGNGEICIEFRSTYLKSALEEAKIPIYKLDKVKYRGGDYIDDDLVHLIKNTLDDAVQTILTTGNVPGIYIRADTLSPEWNSEDRKWTPIFVKNAGFRDEDEWRLATFQPSITLKPGHTVRARGRYLVPYIRVAFNPETAISEIIFGPESDQAVVEDFRRLSKSRYFMQSCRISRSKIPYRA